MNRSQRSAPTAKKNSGTRAVIRRNVAGKNVRGNYGGKGRRVKKERTRVVLDEMAIIMLLNYAYRMDQYQKESMHGQDAKLSVVEIKII